MTKSESHLQRYQLRMTYLDAVFRLVAIAVMLYSLTKLHSNFGCPDDATELHVTNTIWRFVDDLDCLVDELVFPVRQEYTAHLGNVSTDQDQLSSYRPRSAISQRFGLRGGRRKVMNMNNRHSPHEHSIEDLPHTSEPVCSEFRGHAQPHSRLAMLERMVRDPVWVFMPIVILPLLLFALFVVLLHRLVFRFVLVLGPGAVFVLVALVFRVVFHERPGRAGFGVGS